MSGGLILCMGRPVAEVGVAAHVHNTLEASIDVAVTDRPVNLTTNKTP